jgi:hypothetical protein
MSAEQATPPQRPTILNEGFSAVSEIARQAFRTAFSQQSGGSTVLLEEVAPERGPIHGFWLSVILVATPALRVTCKTFFNSSASRALMAKALGRPPESLTLPLVSDFMREFSNVAGGTMKRTVEGLGMSAGLSLPLVTRGFDVVFDRPPAGKNFFIDTFDLRSPDGHGFTCTLDIEVLDVNDFSKIVWTTEVHDESGDMEFL